MAGLIALALLVPAIHSGPPDRQADGAATIEAGRERRYLACLERLQDRPRPADPRWRGAVFQALRWLEFVPVGRVLPSWQRLAAGGGDRDRANLLLYLRRHGLELPPPAVGEGVESALERGLERWGVGDRPGAVRAFQEAVQRFPDDTRMAENLAWLLQRIPETLPAAASPRRVSRTALARRGVSF